MVEAQKKYKNQQIFQQIISERAERGGPICSFDA